MIANQACLDKSMPRRRIQRLTPRTLLLSLSVLALLSVVSPPVFAADIGDAPLITNQLTPADQAELAQAQVEVNREFLADLAANLKTFADFGKQIYDFKDLTLPLDASAETRAFFDKIRLAQAGLPASAVRAPKAPHIMTQCQEFVSRGIAKRIALLAP